MTGAKEVSTPLPTSGSLTLSDGSPFTNASEYRSVIGALQYLAITRPDIAYTVNKLSQFMHQPSEMHWTAAKRLLRYLKGTIFYGLFLKRHTPQFLHAYSDADWAGNLDDRTSTSAYIVYLGGETTDNENKTRMEENSGAMIKLTSAHYSIWKPRIEDVLYTKDLYLPIYGDTKKPQGTSDEDWKVTNRKAVALIRTWVDQSVFHHVAQETNVYELWTKLEAMYERKTAQNKAFLIRRLVNLKYKDGRSVAEHMSDFQGLINQLSTMKLVLDEELQALLLLSSLPDSWEINTGCANQQFGSKWNGNHGHGERWYVQ
ncbi:hypothetical protein RHSIM_Rhsim05G0201800 [Rhododendron simsii]|uniref:Uncharacterized protein n=1 Tax=Rhododendron simsii TaxID=118357 RepID=A0A834H0V8_RHOSS|nr:hypothetical protein RHSIM_Rhsim05G0201800 [Rhododendron simsii]